MILDKERAKVARKLLKKSRGVFVPVDLSLMNPPEWITRAYRNNHYTVMIDDHAPLSNGTTAIKAMIQRVDDAVFPNHWAEIQSIKNEIFGNDAVAVEYYPAESEIVNTHNIYWIWIIESQPIWVNA